MAKAGNTLIRGLILKIASRCNLNCSYCYVYNKGDTTYRDQPRLMSDETVACLLDRVAAYCRQHRPRQFRFIFHGGEPLLASPSFFRRFVAQARQKLPPETTPVFSVQTNGVLLTDAWCRVLGRLDIRIGISIDGLPETHNQFRVDHRGRGSYEAVRAGLLRAQVSPDVRYQPGVLVVVDLAANPITLYQHFKSLNVSGLSLLLPDGTYDQFPPALPASGEQTPYANWLILFFDLWFSEPAAGRMKIPFFEQIISLILGISVRSDMWGRLPNVYLVIETDGSIEAEDSLKICQPGLTKEGYHVQTHSLNQALQAPLIAQCARRHIGLPPVCRRCPIRDVCGGGFIVHRYRAANGFANPSVYCRDLLKLITHIQGRVLQLFPQTLLNELNVQPLSFQEALATLHPTNHQVAR